MLAYSLNRPVILERLGDDEEILAMMIDMYLQDVDNNCSALDSALAAEDASGLLREVHTVKGLLATFADEDGAAMAFALESRLKEGDMRDAEAAIAELQARMSEIAVVLQGEIGG
jgi:HPt (histidine-containing phosphotransfer) domain-containing protein